MRSLSYYYSKKDLDLTENKRRIAEYCDQKDLAFFDLCIDEDPALLERYEGLTPLILIGPYKINWPFTMTEIEVAVNTVLEKDREAAQHTPADNLSDLRLTRLEKLSLWLSRYYIWLITVLIGIFFLSAFIPPYIAIQGNTKLAGKLYKFHQVFCHQLAYRSFFLDGMQTYYPREMAGIQGLLTYEDVTGKKPEDLSFARDFYGNEMLGYKVGLCQRDLAIYSSLLLFGVIFQLTGKKIKPLKWYWWFIIALLPIAIDGFSQLPGLASGWPDWLPSRESTPLLRVVTGALFGGGTAWYMYPLIEETMKETRFQLSRKKAIIEKLQKERR